MRGYFARHASDRSAAGWGSRSNPSAGWIAWLLWGGDAGRAWAERIVRAYEATTSGCRRFTHSTRAAQQQPPSDARGRSCRP
jgi:hypothetical protein